LTEKFPTISKLEFFNRIIIIIIITVSLFGCGPFFAWLIKEIFQDLNYSTSKPFPFF